MGNIDIGKNIAQLRKNNNLTQLGLSIKLGVTNSTVSSWERNRTEPNMGMVEKMCTVFKCKKTDIIGEEEWEKNISSTNSAELLFNIISDTELLEHIMMLKNLNEANRKTVYDMITFLSTQK